LKSVGSKPDDRLPKLRFGILVDMPAPSSATIATRQARTRPTTLMRIDAVRKA
jgi:hypothetical protein